LFHLPAQSDVDSDLKGQRNTKYFTLEVEKFDVKHFGQLVLKLCCNLFLLWQVLIEALQNKFFM
jgi:hypothetical protein